MLIKIAYRNIIKQKKRFVLSLLTLFFCFFFLAMGISLAEGSYDTVIDIFTKNSTGHIKIFKNNYFEDEDFYKLIGNIDDVFITNILITNKNISNFSKRINTKALFFYKYITFSSKIVGIMPDEEQNTTNIKDKIIEGSFFDKLSKHEILISKTLKDLFNLELNKEISIISYAFDGSISNDNFKIIAFIDSEDNYTTFNTLNEFLSLNNKYHEIIINSNNYRLASKLSLELQKLINNNELNIKPWQELKKNFYLTMQKEKQGVWVLLSIVALISMLITLNTILMNILERKKEFALIKAFGLKPFNLFILIILETIILAFISIFLGFIFSYLVNLYLTNYGISYPEPISVSGVWFYKMYGFSSFKIYIIPSLVVFLGSIFVSIAPALKVAYTKPIFYLKEAKF